MLPSGLYPQAFLHIAQAIRLKKRHSATPSPQIGTWCLNSQAFKRMNSLWSFCMAFPPSVHVTSASSRKSRLMAISLIYWTYCLESPRVFALWKQQQSSFDCSGFLVLKTRKPLRHITAREAFSSIYPCGSTNRRLTPWLPQHVYSKNILCSFLNKK